MAPASTIYGPMTDDPFSRDPDEAALAWFAHMRGAPSAADHKAFEEWLAASPAHRTAWRRVESLWAASGDAGLIVAGEEEEKLSAYLDGMERKKRRRALRQTGAALIAALMIFGGVMWLERPNFFQDLTADHVAPRGQRVRVALADGTTVLLNADAALDVDFTDGERRARLMRGTAFFEVAKTGTPFVVETADGEVRVLGTEFDVRTDAEGSLVTLAEGSVEVRSGPYTARLAPGQQVRAAHASLTSVTEADLATALAWREGRFDFYNARLADVVAEIGHYRGGRIVITSGKLADWIVSGSLPLDDPDAALRSLQSTVGFSMRSVGGRLVVLN